MIFVSQGGCAVRPEGVQEGVQLGGRVCSKVGGCAEGLGGCAVR